MKLHSYIVTDDAGFSPNPFWGYCTLADCKPAIRRTAQVGDWIVGLSRKAEGNRLIYAMEVEEVLPYANYHRDKRFAAKIPDYGRREAVWRCGDNIYRPLPSGGFQQLQSMHSSGMRENPEKKAHDLGGVYVLISKRFWYFGSRALELPAELAELKVGRAHKNRFPPHIVSAFLEFIREQPTGVRAGPSVWPDGDESWRVGTPPKGDLSP